MDKNAQVTVLTPFSCSVFFTIATSSSSTSYLPIIIIHVGFLKIIMICVSFQPSLEPRSIHLAFTPVDKHPLPPKEPSPAHFAQPATVQNTHYHLTLHTQLGTLNSNSAHFLHRLTLCNLFNCANFPPSPPSWLADDTNQLLVHSPVESLQSSLQKIFITASASSPPFALPSGWHWISKPTVGQSEHGC